MSLAKLQIPERILRLSKEGLWIVAGQAMAVAGSLASVRLLTELLNPAQYGELALGMTLATLVNQVIMGPICSGTLRYYSIASEQNDLRAYWHAVGRLTLWSIGIIAAAGAIFTGGLLVAARPEWIAMTLAALLFSAFSGCNGVANNIQLAARQRSVVALFQGLDVWARVLIATGLILWLGAQSIIAMAGYCLAAALLLLFQSQFLRKIIFSGPSNPANEKAWLNGIWAFSWPFSFMGIFTWMQLASDRWALEAFNSPQEVGLYVALYQLGYAPMSMATGMLVQFLAPILYQKAGDASDAKRLANVGQLSARLLGTILAVSATAILLACAFHHQIFRLFAAQEYASVSYLLPWMLAAGGLFAAGQSISLNLMSQLKTRVIAGPKIMTAIFGISLNFAGAYFYGIQGVAVAGVIFAASYFLWVAVLLSRPAGLNLNKA